MISTVTTTTVTTIASSTMAAGLGLAAVLCLIAFLIAKELLDAGTSVEGTGEGTAVAAPYPWVRPLSRALTVGIIPLLIGFGFIVLVRVMAVL
ncbi:hypothetical protein [Moorella sulfitireducens (nom. illeg.)]|uniref:hypothetical protein n=1 Tax=Neomoorella sulfitireducens TaxID=2972948 RepID=UPI0021ACA02E|nr:hypothetical protein [Moorella sulfitireducens]